MAHKHSRLTEAGRLVWFVERLWHLARELPVEQVPLTQIAEFDQDCWFGPDTPPTCRAVAEHARRIFDADLRYPILLSAEGFLMDGGHRVAKAYLLGSPTISAVRFANDPAPDYILAPDASLPSEPRLRIPTAGTEKAGQ
jgi:hypothetical protein